MRKSWRIAIVAALLAVAYLGISAWDWFQNPRYTVAHAEQRTMPALSSQVILQADGIKVEANGANRLVPTHLLDGKRSGDQTMSAPTDLSVAYMAIARDNANITDIVAVDLTNGEFRTVAENGSAPVVSPDGRLLAFSRQHSGVDVKKSVSIIVQEVKTGATHEYTSGGAGYFIDGRSLSWSADNRRLAFAEHRIPNQSVMEERVIDVVANTESQLCQFPSRVSVAEPGARWYYGNRLVFVDQRWVDRNKPDRILVSKPNSCEVDYALPSPAVGHDEGSELSVITDLTGEQLLIDQTLHEMTGPEPGTTKDVRQWTWTAHDGLTPRT